MNRVMKLLSIPATALLLLAGCTGVPDGVEPVGNFDADKYLGTWYEIARLDHSFEDGLSRVTAEYSLNDDGSIRVLNRGYNQADDSWEEAEGRAVFTGSRSVGHLKVSFFGPFYSSYVVFDLDDAYSRAYVSGYNRDYLWLLSRTPQVSDAELEAFRDRARAAGFDVDELIIVDHPTAP